MFRNIFVVAGNCILCNWKLNVVYNSKDKQDLHGNIDKKIGDKMKAVGKNYSFFVVLRCNMSRFWYNRIREVDS